MKERNQTERVLLLRRAIAATLLLLVMTFSMTSQVYAWFVTRRDLVSYAPISAPQSFYIGAGHIEFEGKNYYGVEATINQFEDIRYLYLTGIDVTTETEYYDYVFCVYGKAVQSFKLQLAYTTNNQFTYELFHATESNVSGDIAYTTHGATPTTYYCSVNGEAIAGSFLNDKTVDGETLGKNATDEAGNAESERYHEQTYGAYTNVNPYAEPVYWQTNSSIPGNTRDSFVNYFILRVRINGKAMNDRETDVVCIAAKSLS